MNQGCISQPCGAASEQQKTDAQRSESKKPKHRSTTSVSSFSRIIQEIQEIQSTSKQTNKKHLETRPLFISLFAAGACPWFGQLGFLPGSLSGFHAETNHWFTVMPLLVGLLVLKVEPFAKSRLGAWELNGSNYCFTFFTNIQTHTHRYIMRM